MGFSYFVSLLAASLSLSSCFHHERNVDTFVKRQDIVCGEHEEKYRTSDGQCNNLMHSAYGTAGSNFQRLIPAQYSDGVSSPRSTGVDGTPLPHPREISLKCHKPSEAKADVTLMLMQWGQFLDHDITKRLSTTVPEGTDCCTSNDPNCIPIVLENDPYFTDRSCLSCTRSARKLPPGGTVEEQINVLTAFIDASNVYGSSEQERNALRGTKGGLKFSECEGESFLPPRNESSQFCNVNPGQYEFMAGDTRVNVQPGLSSMHTTWMREHNRIATHLRNKHASWDDDRVFEETRRIIAAMMQVITYNEFLPIVLGDEKMNELGLTSSSPYVYNPATRPDICNSFSTAAYRFGHSLVPEGFTIDCHVALLKNMWFNPTETLQHIDELTKGLQTDRVMAVDRHVSFSLTRHLFEKGDRTGSDLASRNILRGRDHGLPPYTKFRALTDKPPTTLTELFKDDPECQAVYKHIDDVDLFTGGLSEPAVGGGVVGPTFAHIIGRQFKNLKFGDRFFYLNSVGKQAFTPEQIAMFNTVKLSKVICLNTDNKQLPKNIFKPSDINTNPVMNCNDIPGLDLDMF